MIINITYDSSVSKAPNEAAFKACVQGVVDFYEAQFTNPITVNIDVGFGEVDGFTLKPGSGAASVSSYTTNNFTYAQIKAALMSSATSADDMTAVASLGADPTVGGVFNMTTAEAKALGLLNATNATVDGFVGIDSGNNWIFNTTNTDGSDVPAGDADAFSFIAHEFAEVLGRQMNFSPKDKANFGGYYMPYDLFDYTGAGVRSFTSTTADRYFSIDSGKTNTGLHYFNNDPSSGDGFDWLPNGQPGSFLLSGPADSYDFEGSIGAVSGQDLRLMDILGYTPTTNFTWAAQVNGAFTTATDWTADVVPGAADSAIFNAPGSTKYAVTVTGIHTVANVVTGATANLAISSGTLTVSGGTVSSFGGTVSGSGNLAFAGGAAADFISGAILTVAKVTLANAATTVTIDDPLLNYSGTWVQGSSPVLSVSAGDRVNFMGSGNSFTGMITGAGTVAFTKGSDTLTGGNLSVASVIVNGADVTLAGVIVNKTTISVTSPNLTIAAAGASLASTGQIALTNTVGNEIIGATASATLTNVNNTIDGSGDLGGGQMVLVNDIGGKIIGNHTLGLTIDTGAATITNAGQIQNTGTGGTTVASAINNTGTFIVTAGTLKLEGAVTGAGSMRIVGGVADVATTAFTENVLFTGGGGALELASAQTYTGQITGFSKTGATSLDLGDISFVSGVTKATYSGSTSSGLLTVTDGLHTAKITLMGNYLASVFTTSSDGHGGTTVVDPIASGGRSALVSAISAFGGAEPSHSVATPDWSPARTSMALARISAA